MFWCVAPLLAFLLLPVPAAAAPLDMDAVNDAQWAQRTTAKGRIVPIMIKAQVLLDRTGFRPARSTVNPERISARR